MIDVLDFDGVEYGLSVTGCCLAWDAAPDTGKIRAAQGRGRSFSPAGCHAAPGWVAGSPAPRAARSALVAQARAANPHLKEADALTAMDMGARRLDLIGLKFELAQEIVDVYADVLARQHDKAHSSDVRNELDKIGSMFGRCQDLRDAYSASKGEYSQVWLSENRPYWLNNVTVRFDLRIEEWQRRGERFAEVSNLFGDGKELPPPSALGLPAPQAAK